VAAEPKSPRGWAPEDWLASANVAGAIYGQILVTSIVAALSEEETLSAQEIFIGVLGTMLVFWLAHVYAAAVARRLSRREPLRLREILDIANDEWPMVQSAAPALVALGLAWAGVFSTSAGVDLAIAAGIGALFAWGFVIARRSGLSPAGTLGSIALSGAFGLAIVGLKTVVH
jgi:hypothetical protein